MLTAYKVTSEAFLAMSELRPVLPNDRHLEGCAVLTTTRLSHLNFHLEIVQRNYIRQLVVVIAKISETVGAIVISITVSRIDVLGCKQVSHTNRGHALNNL